ncbi:GNAT family N-acetyltransferase [Sporosarcina sp. G11-34]|uniref:GNAT family N-acetyltransferase n=1 Tax=Sporosarcina sp. G11-34 TaxID=2849605 RepID=UPI0022A913C5|nr:GNAT family N-acetyltransferase [Sporosarcina sp. G11-34]MCZ2259501.1 GNAT family N-acetyltransferase [Sporosarcina sp. G11-34]
MLLRYKKTYEKIAMGLLSYMPGEKNVKKLQETIHRYETESNWQLFLLKKDEDFIGLIGLEMGEDAYTLHHISINPSFRGEGIGKEMVLKLQTLFPEKKCISTEDTESFLKKCALKGEGAED